MKQTWVSAAMFAAVAIQATDASAQAWLADRAYAEGAGIRTGNVEIHPGVGAEVGYDYNYFQRSPNDYPDEPIESAIRIRITPHISIATLGQERAGGVQPPDVTFRLDAQASYNELIPGNSDSDDISQQRNIVGGIAGSLDIAPRRPFGADLKANFDRTVEPSNSAAGDASFNRITVGGGGGLRWSPGGGLFSNRLGYALKATLFSANSAQGYSNLQHTIEADSRWRFLPRTALLYRGRLTFLGYNRDNTSQNGGELVHSWLGINGLLTKYFGFLLMGGWGATFFDQHRAEIPAENYDGPIGQAELTWYLKPNPNTDPNAPTVGLSSIAVGYLHDFQNSYFGDYYQIDRVYGSMAYFAGGAFLLTVGAGYSRVTRPTIWFPGRRVSADADLQNCTPSPCLPSKGEDRVDAAIFAEYRVSSSVGINTTLRYNANLTQTLIPGTLRDPNGTVDDLQFQRWEAYLGARWFL